MPLLQGLRIGGAIVGQGQGNETYDSQADWDTGTPSADADTVTTDGSVVLRRAFVNDANTVLLAHMDNNLNDASDNANNGTGTGTFETTRQIGSHSYLSNATGEAAEFPDIAAYDVSNITVEAWVYITALTGTHGIVVRASNSVYSFYLAATTTITQFYIAFTEGAQSATGGVLPTGQWVHVAGTYNGSRLSLWIDGVEADGLDTTRTMPSTAHQIAVGGYPADTSTTFPLNGYIDEVRISDTARYSASFTPQPYATSGTWTSPVIDTGADDRSASRLNWDENLPTANEDITWEHRASNDNPPTGAFTALTGNSPITSGFVDTGRYHQLQATLTTVAGSANTPSLDSATFTYIT